MILQKLTIEDKEVYLRYIKSWEESGEKIVPFASSLNGKNYEEWLKISSFYENKENCPEDYVPGAVYFLKNDEKIIGAIALRYELNEKLRVMGGNVGYGVSPEERKKGYASLMLKLIKNEAKKMGMKELLVTCDTENIASAKTIIKNGGILENEIEYEGTPLQRYWIKL